MIKAKLKPFLLVVILSFSFLITFSNSRDITSSLLNQPNNGDKNWTVMLYYCADTRANGLNPYPDNSGPYNWLHNIMLECKSSIPIYLTSGSLNDLNIILLYDEPYTQQYPNGRARLYQIGYSNPPTELADWGTTDMGAYITLKNFINYCKTNFPANHYALALTDHGRGYAGFCYDYHSQHPYWNYSLGDCLTVSELRVAINLAGGLDVLFLDTCSGGSFEVAWELADDVAYIIAGEPLQGRVAIAHAVDFLMELSQDTSMSPFEFAQVGFDTAADIFFNPPSLPNNEYKDWSSVSLYSAYRFDLSPIAASFKEKFDDFTNELIAELNSDFTRAQELFGLIRSECSGYGFSSGSMLIDLYEFLEIIDDYSANFTNPGVVTKAATVRSYLDVDPAGILTDFFVREDLSLYDNLHGFSICFPDSRDHYQGYLYPNMYDELAIADESHWDEFIFSLFPPESDNFLWPIPEFWEVNLNPIDPLVHLHVFLTQDPLKNPLHVGLATGDLGLSEIELGIEGSEYLDNLLYGQAMIRIPATSLASAKANGEQTFSVVINATCASSVTKPANLTVRHVIEGEIAWEGNQVTSLEMGQALSCEVSTSEKMTELKPVGENTTTTPPTTTEPPTTSEPNTTAPSDTNTSGYTFTFGPAQALVSSAILISTTIIVIVVFRRKKKS